MASFGEDLSKFRRVVWHCSYVTDGRRQVQPKLFMRKKDIAQCT